MLQRISKSEENFEIENLDLHEIYISSPELYSTENLEPIKKDDFARKIFKFWNKFIFKHFSQFENDGIIVTKCDDDIFETLMTPLKEYLANTTNYEDFFIIIQIILSGSSVCMKDCSDKIAYICKDCSINNSILCQNCFKNSAHVEHNYKVLKNQMGFCDCSVEGKKLF